MVIQTQNAYLLIILPAIVLRNASVTIHKEQKSNLNIVYDDLYISLHFSTFHCLSYWEQGSRTCYIQSCKKMSFMDWCILCFSLLLQYMYFYIFYNMFIIYWKLSKFKTSLSQNHIYENIQFCAPAPPPPNPSYYVNV